MTGVRPTLVVLGAMKCGTSSLYEYLRAHPEVFMSEKKELNFFSDDEVYARGVAWYESHFDGEASRTAIARGEASPRYTMSDRSPATAARMHDLLPDARLVYLVRNPIDRIQSHYHHRLRKGDRLRPIDEEVIADPAYVGTSSYATRLEPFLRVYPRDQLLVVASDALLGERTDAMHTVYEFIGVDPDVVPQALGEEHARAADYRVPRTRLRRLRRSPVVAPIVEHVPRAVRGRVAKVTTVPSDSARLAPATRERLASMLADDVRHLREVMPPGFDGWGIG